MNERQAALEILQDVFDHGQSLTSALKKRQEQNKPIIKQYSFGVCRWYFQLDLFLKQLLTKKIKEKDHDIRLLLLLGIYEISHMNSKHHAVVNECIKIAKAKNKAWAAGLVNAVLRNFIRQHSHLKNDTYAHPKWLLKSLQSAWPNQWHAIVEANNEHPPMTLRINQQKISPEEYQKKYRVEGITHIDTPEALTLTTPVPINKLPGFEQGEVAVQDQCAQLAAHLLKLKPGQRVLDACAAPGGKTCHIAECEPMLAQLTAIDVDATRVAQIHENLQRLGLSANVVIADALQPEAWWDNQPYDRILLDAPCSATGVIRRHPDIKIHRQAADIPPLSIQQARLLSTLWPLLKPEGYLLYATCSVLPEENQDIIEAFVAQNKDAKIQDTTLAQHTENAFGLQCFPTPMGGDGFFYALLKKSTR